MDSHTHIRSAKRSAPRFFSVEKRPLWPFRRLLPSAELGRLQEPHRLLLLLGGLCPQHAASSKRESGFQTSSITVFPSCFFLGGVFDLGVSFWWTPQNGAVPCVRFLYKALSRGSLVGRGFAKQDLVLACNRTNEMFVSVEKNTSPINVFRQNNSGFRVFLLKSCCGSFSRHM